VQLYRHQTTPWTFYFSVKPVSRPYSLTDCILFISSFSRPDIFLTALLSFPVSLIRWFLASCGASCGVLWCPVVFWPIGMSAMRSDNRDIRFSNPDSDTLLGCTYHVNVYMTAYRVHVYTHASLIHSRNPNPDSSNRISPIITYLIVKISSM